MKLATSSNSAGPVVSLAEARAEIRDFCLGDKSGYLSRFLMAYIATLLPLATTLVLACVFPHPLLLVAVGLVSAFTQNALGILMHEASHYFLHPNAKINDRLADAFVCLPIFNTVAGYRASHMEHHRSNGDRSDPAFPLYGDVHTRRQVVLGCLADICGLTSFYSFTKRYSSDRPASKRSSSFLPLCGLVQLGIFLLYWQCTQYVWAYFALWFVPLLTVPALINRLRTIVEHQPGDAEPGTPVNRSTVPTTLEYLLIAPYGYAFHFEHHLQLNVPFHQLNRAHQRLQACGFAFGDRELATRGYLRTFVRLLRQMK